ncbi:MAG TPA: chaperone modulator CbpM [Steroidobacteraceae bacterium]|jgi:chaperone modulatory protein CbpM
MTLPDEPCLTGEIFDERSALSVNDLRRLIAVEERHIVEWVEEGVINVLEVDAAEWRFSGAQLRRARIALRLERDLGVNAAGVALALELLEELEQLRRAQRIGRS